MTVQTAHPGHHISLTTAGTALAGALLAAAAGYGVAALVLDDAPMPVPTGVFEENPNDLDRYYGFDPNGFAGTDREERSLQHRR